MTLNIGGSQPQDRLPGEQPQPYAAMPVIGANGEIVHQPGSTGTPTTPATGSELVPVAAGAGARGRTHVAVFSDVRRDRGELSGAVSVFGEVQQSGAFTLAERTSVVSVFGGVVLDLREATLAAHDVRIDVVAAFGDLKVIVPPGLDVDITGFVALGDHKLKTTTPPLPGSPRVTVRTVGAFSDVKIVELAKGEHEPSLLERLRGRR